jgi:hypothetical protein
MGNQASHKQIRGDSLRPNQHNQASASNVAYPGGVITGPGGFVYPSEEYPEEFEDQLYSSQYSKSSNVNFR